MQNNPMVLSAHRFDVVLVQDENVTTAAVDIPNAGGFVGSAKRHPADKHQSDVGIYLAISRLLGQLSEFYAEKAQEAQTVGKGVDAMKAGLERLFDLLGVPEAERL